MEPNDILKLSDSAVYLLNEFIKPIITQEYIGWIVPLPKRFKSVFVVDYSENKYWSLLHKDANKKLSKKQITRALKFLQKHGWLHPAYLTPFEEFSPQLQVDPKYAMLIPPEQEIKQENIVDSFPEMNIIYNDDISGITLLDEENEDGDK